MKRADWHIDLDCRRRELPFRPHPPPHHLDFNDLPSVIACLAASTALFAVFTPELTHSHQR